MRVKQRMRYLSQHDVVLNRPPEQWWKGQFVGNGRIGGVVSFPGCYEIIMNKLDIWSCHPQKSRLLPHAEVLKFIKQKKLGELLAAFTAENELGVSSPVWGCRLRLYAGDKHVPQFIGKFKQRLALGTGEIITEIRSRGKSTRIETAFAMDANVMLLSIADRDLAGQVFECYRPPAEICIPDKNRAGAKTGQKKTGEVFFQHDGDDQWLDARLPGGFRYVVAWRISRNLCRVTRGEHCLRATFNNRVPALLQIPLAMVTSAEETDPVAAARRLLDNAQRKGFKVIRRESGQWWERFWARSFIEIPDKLVENLWYLHLHQLACTSRDSVAPGLHGLWFVDEIRWKGAYVGDANLSMTYWPVFGANHLDLLRPYLETIQRAVSAWREETKEVFGYNGIKAPCYFSPYLPKEMGGGIARYCICSTPMYAQLFWWYYTYSGDRDALKNIVYPFLRETVRFLVQYARTGDDGKFHIGPSFSPEQGPRWATDTVIDLAYFKYCLRTTIQASEILAADAGERGQWKKALGRLADYPVHDGVLVDSRTWKEQEQTDLMSNQSHAHVEHLRHAALYTPLYPIQEAGLHNPESDLFKSLKRTFDIRFQQLGVYDRIENHNSFCWGWYACLAAHLGLGDKALELLYDRGISCQMLANGMFVQQINDVIRRPNQSPIMMIDGCSTFLTAVNEMLLQSVGGEIYVFPALPSSWRDCYFDGLLAEGAFVIGAEKRDGNALYIHVHSKAGNHCALKNLWSGEKILVTDEHGTAVITAKQGHGLTFPTRPNGSYVVRPARLTGVKQEHRLSTGRKRNTPRRWVWRQGTLGT